MKKAQIINDIGAMINDTIAVNELPKPYKTGLGFLKLKLYDYILKASFSHDVFKTVMATRIRKWQKEGLITKSQVSEIINYELKNW